jgi:hypothetical protein
MGLLVLLVCTMYYVRIDKIKMILHAMRSERVSISRAALYFHLAHLQISDHRYGQQLGRTLLRG